MADGTEVRHKAQHNRYGTWPCVFRHRNPNPCPLLAAAVADGTPDVQGPAKLPGNPDGIDLDDVKATHRVGLRRFCDYCQQRWPCDSTRLAAEVERLRADRQHGIMVPFPEFQKVAAERDGLLARIRAVEKACDDAIARSRKLWDQSVEDGHLCGDWPFPEQNSAILVTVIRAALAAPAGESANPDCAPSGAESGPLPTATAAGGTSVVQPEDSGE